MPKIREIVWAKSFKRAFRKRVIGKPCERMLQEKLNLFAENPYDARLRTHKLTGKLDGLWSLAVTYDCPVVFKFLSDERVLLIDVGTHDKVY